MISFSCDLVKENLPHFCGGTAYILQQFNNILKPTLFLSFPKGHKNAMNSLPMAKGENRSAFGEKVPPYRLYRFLLSLTIHCLYPACLRGRVRRQCSPSPIYS